MPPPGRVSRTDDLIQACASRQSNYKQRKHRSQFTFAKAQTAIEAYTKPIFDVADLKRVKGLPDSAFRELSEVLAGVAPIHVAPPTPQQLAKAANKAEPESRLVPEPGTGRYAILIVLSDGQIWHKDDIIRDVERRRLCNSTMRSNRDNRGITAWKANEELSVQGLIRVKKGGYGNKNEYQITAVGRDVVNQIFARYGNPGQGGGGGGAAGGAAGPGHNHHGQMTPTRKRAFSELADFEEDLDSDDEPGYVSVPRHAAAGSSTGPAAGAMFPADFGRQSYGMPAAAAPAAAPTPLSPGRVLGPGRGPSPAASIVEATRASWAKRQQLLNLTVPAPPATPANRATDKGKGPAAFECPICGEHFGDEAAVDRHLDFCGLEEDSDDEFEDVGAALGNRHQVQPVARAAAPAPVPAPAPAPAQPARAPPAAPPVRATAPAAQQATMRGPLVGPMTVTCVVDGRERNNQKIYLNLFTKVRAAMPTHPDSKQTIFNAAFEINPVCDYLFVRSNPGAQLADVDTPEWSKTNFVLPVGIERKTLADLAGRSYDRDHIKQWARMARADIAEVIPKQFWLIEGLDLARLKHMDVYREDGRMDLRRGEKLDSQEEFFALLWETILIEPAGRVKIKVINVQDDNWTAAFCVCVSRYLGEWCRRTGQQVPMEPSFATFKTKANRRDMSSTGAPMRPDVDDLGRIETETKLINHGKVFEVRNEKLDDAKVKVFVSKPGIGSTKVYILRVKAIEFMLAIARRLNGRIGSFADLSRTVFAWIEGVVKAPVGAADLNRGFGLVILETPDVAIRQFASRCHLERDSITPEPLDFLLSCALVIMEKQQGWHVQMTKGDSANICIDTAAWFLDRRPPSVAARAAVAGGASGAGHGGPSVLSSPARSVAQTPRAVASPAGVARPRPVAAPVELSDNVIVIEDSQNPDDLEAMDDEDSQDVVVVSRTQVAPAPRRSTGRPSTNVVDLTDL